MRNKVRSIAGFNRVGSSDRRVQGLNAVTRTVWVLSVVSLLTDTASEMLYPIMPIYLKSIGFSIVFIGVLEGVAEAMAGFSKGYFGKLSDLSGRRVAFVQIGYAMSAISKPMMAICTVPLWVLGVRTLDRLGKGVRTAARDAMLSDEASPETKGTVFGFHRAMDTIGAVIGPAIAWLYLSFYPQDYKTLFFIAFIPGLLAILFSLSLKEKKISPPQPNMTPSFFSFLKYWKESPAEYRKVVLGLLIFTLFNSSDIFLLLQAKQSGLEDRIVIGIYIFYNLIYALFSFPVGILADRVGLKAIFIIGLTLFATVYWGMAINTNLYVFFLLFFLYGIYAAATEGISKAWISNITDRKDKATAIGTFSALQSVFAMLASSLAGLIWFQFGAPATFMTTSIVTLCVILYFLLVPQSVNQNKKGESADSP